MSLGFRQRTESWPPVPQLVSMTLLQSGARNLKHREKISIFSLAAVESEQLRDSLGSLKASREVIWEVMELQLWAQQPQQESSGLQRCRGTL